MNALAKLWRNVWIRRTVYLIVLLAAMADQTGLFPQQGAEQLHHRASDARRFGTNRTRNGYCQTVQTGRRGCSSHGRDQIAQGQIGANGETRRVTGRD